jgi:branched-chain amino acid transport system ATP-binding protein
MLEVNQLRAGYGRVAVLHSLSIAVERGSITALIGSNGAGKTTLLRAILGAIPTTAGTIIFNGERVDSRPAFQRIRGGVALSPEGRLVFPSMSVEENLRLGAVAHGDGEIEARQYAKVLSLFPKLKDRLGQSAGSLSGGEQQMLAVGRALMSAPTLLLLDEPTLGLAPVMADRIFDAMAALKANGLTILVAEQNTRRTLEISDQAYVVENGRIAFAGAGAALVEDERVRTAFLGI